MLMLDKTSVGPLRSRETRRDQKRKSREVYWSEEEKLKERR
jgi:hypothetical protein